MTRFELKEDHIKLINKMYVYFDDCSYDGAPAIDSKRPYGNSSVACDVYEILFGKEFDYDEHDEMPEELYEDLMKVHKETATALQIVLCTKSFEPGVYEKTSRYDSLSWKKVSCENTYIHMKSGGKYTILGEAEVQAKSARALHDYDAVVVYKSVSAGSLWVRPKDEFYDGRFVKID